nr:hypothetical protein [uncultured bacterium]
MSSDNEQWVAALDVGGRSIKYGAVSESGALLGRSATSVDSDGSMEHILDALRGSVTAALSAAPRSAAPTSPSQVSIAFPEPFDYAAGTPLLRHKFASLHGLDLTGAIVDSVTGDLEISYLNDAVAAGIGEMWLGAGDSERKTLMITLGTGLGACLVLRGGPVSPTGGLFNTPVGDLYLRATPLGVADDVFSARGLATRLGTSMGNLEAAVERTRQVEPDESGEARSARRLIEQFGADLGRFLSPVIDSVGAELLLIGGGLVAAFDLFGSTLTEIVEVETRAARLGNDAALYGAARHRFDLGRPGGGAASGVGD